MNTEQYKKLDSRADEGTRFMQREITHICRTFGKRDPGSRGERLAAEYMADQLKQQCGCGSVSVESFTEHPSAFYNYFRISMVFDTLCCIGWFIHPVVSIISGGIAMLLFIFQFLLYGEWIDPLFPKRESVNITAVRKCTSEPRQRIFLNGHIDAAWEFPLNYRFGGVVFEIPGLMALIGVLWYITLAVLMLAGCDGLRPFALAGLIFIPFFILMGNTYDPSCIVDGANDDLTGCYIGISILKQLQDMGIELDHTELGVILTGSEEAGLRGAKAWCRSHRDEESDIPTYIISYDTIHDPDQLMVNMRDLNGLQPSDACLGEMFLQAAHEAGVPCKKGWVPPFGGATDSAAFTQGGFRSIGITGLNHKLEDYYHTRRDSYDNLDLRGMENCLRATLKLICNFENTGCEGAANEKV